MSELMRPVVRCEHGIPVDEECPKCESILEYYNELSPMLNDSEVV